MTSLRDYVLHNREHWDKQAPDYVASGERHWAQASPTWGIWGVPESELRMLPGDPRGKDAIISSSQRIGRASGPPKKSGRYGGVKKLFAGSSRSCASVLRASSPSVPIPAASARA